MANVVVVSACDLRCPTCFAQSQPRARQGNGSTPFISAAEFARRLDFLDRSGIPEIRLIGGEPTLHPGFAELIGLARQRRKHIVVFSHGLVPEAALRCLEELPAGECTIIVNMNASRAADGPTASEAARRRRTVERLGPRALLGFTIAGPGADLVPLLELIAAAGCQKVIRLGLSQPAPVGANAHLNPKRYPAVGRAIAGFARTAAEAGVRLSFDCGFVRCMFSDADFAALQDAQADLDWRCSPVLDVDLTGTALHCFPLSLRLREPLDEAIDAAALIARLSSRAAPYRLAGVYPECSSCSIRGEGRCGGGCLAVTLRRFRSRDVRIPA